MSNASLSPSEPPPRKRIAARPVVKVQLPDPGVDAPAVAYSRDRKVLVVAPRSVLARRLGAGERVGYFQAEVAEDGVVDLGDRVAAPEPRW